MTEKDRTYEMQKKVHFFALFCSIKKLGLRNYQKIIFSIISKPHIVLLNQQKTAIRYDRKIFKD